MAVHVSSQPVCPYSLAADVHEGIVEVEASVTPIANANEAQGPAISKKARAPLGPASFQAARKKAPVNAKTTAVKVCFGKRVTPRTANGTIQRKVINVTHDASKARAERSRSERLFPARSSIAI